MENYKEKLKEYNEGSIWSLRETIKYFKDDMSTKNKSLFGYLLKRLEEEEILYYFRDKFYIIVENTNFYFEMFDDLSVDYINFENKREDIDFKSKKDINTFISYVVESINKTSKKFVQSNKKKENRKV